MCRLSGTGLLQILIQTTSWIGLVRVISTFGSAAVAGLHDWHPHDPVCHPAIVGPGQCGGDDGRAGLGAGKPERAERAVWTAGFYNMVFLGRWELVFVVFTPAIVSIYTVRPRWRRHAVECLRIVSLGFVFYAYGMVLTNSFNGAGDTWTPTWINFACFWLWEIPLAWLLALELATGRRGVYIAVTIAFSTVAVVSAVLFRRGQWKVKRV